MTVILGITGTIGSGKSTVGRLLQEAKVPVFDSDHIVHALLTNENPVREAVISRFGNEIRRPDGAVDRKKLGALVFNDDLARKDLESIVHPAVRAQIRQHVHDQSQSPVVAFLVPLLFEAGSQAQYDEVWTVVADEEVLRERLKARDKLDDDAARRRLSAQMPQSEKAARAAYVIDNSGSVERTREQVLEGLGRLQKLQELD
jgi:dephospho-CoA kinase